VFGELVVSGLLAHKFVSLTDHSAQTLPCVDTQLTNLCFAKVIYVPIPLDTCLLSDSRMLFVEKQTVNMWDRILQHNFG